MLNHTAISESGIKTRTSVWISSPLQNEQDCWNAAKQIALSCEVSMPHLCPSLQLFLEKWKHPHSIPTGVLQLPTISLESSDNHQHQSAERERKGGQCTAGAGRIGRDQDVPLGSHKLLKRLPHTCLRPTPRESQVKHSLHHCPLPASLPALGEEKFLGKQARCVSAASH